MLLDALSHLIGDHDVGVLLAVWDNLGGCLDELVRLFSTVTPMDMSGFQTLPHPASSTTLTSSGSTEFILAGQNIIPSSSNITIITSPAASSGPGSSVDEASAPLSLVCSLTAFPLFVD